MSVGSGESNRRPTAGHVTAYGRPYIGLRPPIYRPTATQKDLKGPERTSGTAQSLPDYVRSHIGKKDPCPLSLASLRISTDIAVQDKVSLVRTYNCPSGTAQRLPDSVRSHLAEPHPSPRSSASLRISTEMTVQDKDSLVRIYNCPSGTARWRPSGRSSGVCDPCP